MVRAGNQTSTSVQTANGEGFHGEKALPFFLERYADAYRLQLEKFLSAVNGDVVRLPQGADGLRALEIADAAQRSADSGSPAPV
jgi:myo-inositol 2-dehydrogenase/D-chiro-inositol 1-dehydrogenase